MYYFYYSIYVMRISCCDFYLFFLYVNRCSMKSQWLDIQPSVTVPDLLNVTGTSGTVTNEH